MVNQEIKQTNNEVLSTRFVLNVIWKTLLLFIICNLLFAITIPLSWLGKISAYNILFPGRSRLPWSENPSVAYSLSLNNLDAMFASHEVAGGNKPTDEFRVLVFGDSSVWGFLLEPEETYTAYINANQLVTQDGKNIRVYNLGYPTISLTKDLLLIDFAMQYQPDMIVWLVTLESFPDHKQVFTPLVQHNPQFARYLIASYNLGIDLEHEGFVMPSFWDKTIIGSRRPLADLLWLQLYGIMWAATGIDQDIPGMYKPRQEDFEIDNRFYDFAPPKLSLEGLAFDVLAAGVDRGDGVPVLIINEPIFISQGENSQIRYNFLYPRWAYDSYRQLMDEQSELQGWNYIDFWDSIPATEFTNTAIHITPEASEKLASIIGEAILALANEIQIDVAD